MTRIWDSLFVVELLVASAFAYLVGRERLRSGKPVGARTLGTVAVGACLVGHISLLEATNPMRLAVGVVTGVGFLGAGLMFRGPDDSVQNATTAATIWTVAIVSMVTGMGHLAAALPAMAALYAFIIMKRYNLDGSGGHDA